MMMMRAGWVGRGAHSVGVRRGGWAGWLCWFVCLSFCRRSFAAAAPPFSGGAVLFLFAAIGCLVLFSRVATRISFPWAFCCSRRCILQLLRVFSAGSPFAPSLRHELLTVFSVWRRRVSSAC